MTARQAKLQALITEIEALLGKASPRLPWVMAGEANQQRQVLEETYQYLKGLDATAPGGWGSLDPETGEIIAGDDPTRADTEANSQQVLQALLQEMQYLRSQTLQPLRTEVIALQQQREQLLSEVRELEHQRLQAAQSPANALPPPLVDELVDRLRDTLLSQLHPRFQSPPPGEQIPATLYGEADMPTLEAGNDLPQLHPQQRLEQLRHIQAQTDYMLLKLDTNLRTVFESMEQSIQSYRDSLHQGIDTMHGLGQQGEVIFKTLINHLAQQLGQEQTAYLDADVTSIPTQPPLAAQAASAQFSEPASSSDHPDSDLTIESLGTTSDLEDETLDVDAPEAEEPEADLALSLDLDDLDLGEALDADEDITLFQLDGEITQLQLDDDETSAAQGRASLPEEDVTLVQTEPLPWPGFAGQSDAETGSSDAAAEPDEAPHTEIDALYESLFGEAEPSAPSTDNPRLEPTTEPEEVDSSIEQALFETDTGPILDAIVPPESVDAEPENKADSEVGWAVDPADNAEPVSESSSKAATAPETDDPSLETLDPDLGLFEIPAEIAASLPEANTGELSASLKLSDLLGTDETPEETQDKSDEATLAANTIDSLADLLPSEGEAAAPLFEGMAPDLDVDEDSFIPASSDEDLLSNPPGATPWDPALKLNADALDQLSTDLSDLEGTAADVNRLAGPPTDSAAPPASLQSAQTDGESAPTTDSDDLLSAFSNALEPEDAPTAPLETPVLPDLTLEAREAETVDIDLDAPMPDLADAETQSLDQPLSLAPDNLLSQDLSLELDLMPTADPDTVAEAKTAKEPNDLVLDINDQEKDNDVVTLASAFGPSFDELSDESVEVTSVDEAPQEEVSDLLEDWNDAELSPRGGDPPLRETPDSALPNFDDLGVDLFETEAPASDTTESLSLGDDFFELALEDVSFELDLPSVAPEGYVPDEPEPLPSPAPSLEPDSEAIREPARALTRESANDISLSTFENDLGEGGDKPESLETFSFGNGDANSMADPPSASEPFEDLTVASVALDDLVLGNTETAPTAALENFSLEDDSPAPVVADEPDTPLATGTESKPAAPLDDFALGDAAPTENTRFSLDDVDLNLNLDLDSDLLFEPPSAMDEVLFGEDESAFSVITDPSEAATTLASLDDLSGGENAGASIEPAQPDETLTFTTLESLNDSGLADSGQSQPKTAGVTDESTITTLESLNDLDLFTPEESIGPASDLSVEPDIDLFGEPPPQNRGSEDVTVTVPLFEEGVALFEHNGTAPLASPPEPLSNREELELFPTEAMAEPHRTDENHSEPITLFPTDETTSEETPELDLADPGLLDLFPPLVPSGLDAAPAQDDVLETVPDAPESAGGINPLTLDSLLSFEEPEPSLPEQWPAEADPELDGSKSDHARLDAFETATEQSADDLDIEAADIPDLSLDVLDLAPDHDVLASLQTNAADFDEAEPVESQGLLATAQTPDLAHGESEEPIASPASDQEWFLGLDFGTTGLSAVLMNRSDGQAYPLYWTDAGIASTTAETLFRLPVVAVLQPTDEGAQWRLGATGSEALTLNWQGDAAQEAGSKLATQLKAWLTVGLPDGDEQGDSHPQLQWSDHDTLPLSQVLAAVEALLTPLSQLKDGGAPIGAAGLDESRLSQILQQLQGVIVGHSTLISDTYRINLREVILETQLVSAASQVLFVEDAIAAVLSGLPDPSEPLAPQGQPTQTLYQCNWQGGTVVISAGASSTDLGIVNLPNPLNALSREDFTLRSLAYGGDALDLDVICQLLLPADRRQTRSAGSKPPQGSGWDWQAASPEVQNSRWETLALETLDLPRIAEPDLTARIPLRQRLESSPLGQSLLEAARHGKLILQNQAQFHLELGDQSWRVLRRDLESRILVPYIQRINQHLNALMSETGLSSQSIHQVICTGGNASFATIARWLRQKFPNATIIQDTYPSDRPPSCSRVAYGLVNLCRYPQVLDGPRHQYSDYFLLQELLQVMPDQPMPLQGIMHLLDQQGVNTEVCHPRILALLEGHLPPGLVPDMAGRSHLSKATLERDRALVTDVLFTRQSGQIYAPNVEACQRMAAHLNRLMAGKQQSLSEPLLAQWVTP